MSEALSKSKTKGEFSVWWFDPKGVHHPELRFCGGEEAVEMAHNLTTRPGAAIGIIRRVIITDGGDCCCFEWRYEEGVVFPPKRSQTQ